MQLRTYMLHGLPPVLPLLATTCTRDLPTPTLAATTYCLLLTLTYTCTHTTTPDNSLLPTTSYLNDGGRGVHFDVGGSTANGKANSGANCGRVSACFVHMHAKAHVHANASKKLYVRP